MKVLERATVAGLEIEYELRGTGEPEFLIHRGVREIWAEPLHSELLNEAVGLIAYPLAYD